MQKVILDTNVIISALLSPGVPAQILERLIIERRVRLCISEKILAEYVEVLDRPKFNRFPEFQQKAVVVLNIIKETAEPFAPEQKIDLIKDKSDNVFLELAVESTADFIITGNAKDFNMDKIGSTKIVSPREYWDHYKPPI